MIRLLCVAFCGVYLYVAFDVSSSCYMWHSMVQSYVGFHGSSALCGISWFVLCVGLHDSSSIRGIL